MRTAFLALVISLAAAISGCSAGQTASAETNTITAFEEAEAVDRALSAAASYFTAYNDGDADAIRALLTEGAEFSDSFTGSITRDAWEQRLEWNLAQQTRLASPDCAVESESIESGVADVLCESATLDAQIQAVGARPVPTFVRLTVSPRGVEAIGEEYGQPDFLAATTPFREWLEDRHSEVVGQIGFGAWDSISDAAANGRLTRDYARRWAAWLEENCVHIPDLISPDRDSYLDDC